MKIIKTAIIPSKQTFVKVKSQPHKLDFKAICVYTALGFFLDDDTYWLDTKVLSPATLNTIDENGYLVKSEKWFNWHYTPKNITLEDVVTEFTTLFESIVKEQTESKKIILPLSGGLDSRTQVVALFKLNANVNSYSYSFQNGYKESSISKKLAKVGEFSFSEFIIPKGYLWHTIDKLAIINNCYSEFTHPRQMAVIDEVSKLGDCFSLGHWGDVLFDSDNLEQHLLDNELLPILKKKVLKKGGLELAKSLWNHWGLEDDFENYLDTRLISLLSKIDITNSNAKLRAFKSMYWAPRWTSINLSVFESVAPIHLPYYDDRMCKFICEIPEELLANRQIQIEYIKKNNTEMAKVVWQDARPFNLLNYKYAKAPYNIPYRFINKSKRVFNDTIGKQFVQRNWELQFLGKENKEKLVFHLFSEEFTKVIDVSLIQDYCNLFYKTDQVYYSHSLSMLLTLSNFIKTHKNV
ncbi:MAG: asparagine synthetase B family protein [Polaribacter sp.]|nr:asparagine synthetase B family protein [Polaribacter sp.]MDG2356930.1 asparagine synthetase B family protein [Polaribacter sp.]